MIRVVVFSGNLTYSVRKGIVDLDAQINDFSWLIVLHTPERTFGRLARNQWRNLLRNGFRWVPYQTRDLLNRLGHKGGPLSDKVYPGSAYSLESLRLRPNVRIISVRDINEISTINRVREFEPDLGISLAAPILQPALFKIPSRGTLNLHKGRLPDYRGMPPAFWEFWNDEPSVGCTVHWVAEKLDTGDIVREESIERQTYSTFQGMQLRLDEVGINLMSNAVKDVFSGFGGGRPQGEGGKTYRKPTLAQVSSLEHRFALPKKKFTVAAKAFVKTSLVKGLVLGSALGLKRMIPPRVTVLLYHRVTDEVRDNLTVGIAQFERQMALIRKRCKIVSIEEVLSRSTIEATTVPIVAVTFDDGYLDNYENAVPILERHGVPAAFFVSTGIVNSDRQFPHDVLRNNSRIPVMSWNQLRDMRDRGFTIGSHSVSHIDCGAEPLSAVAEELKRSRLDLTRELGLVAPIFAYPYGGRAHMTPAALEQVKQAGYVGCLSAYGGSNVRSVDPYNVLRRAIHWEFSDSAFLLECYGLH